MNDPGVPAPVPLPYAAGLPPGALTFGQILDRIYHLARSNFRLFASIAAVPAACMAIFYAVMVAAMLLLVKPWQQQPAHLALRGTAWLFAAEFFCYLPLLVIYALYEAAGNYAALQANAGVKTTFAESWAMAWRRAGRYIWLAILRTLVVALPILAIGGLVGGSIALTALRAKGSFDPTAILALIPLFLLLYLVAMVYATLAMLRLILAVPACVAEDLGTWSSICRSNKLTEGSRGRIFLLGLVVYAVLYAACLVLEVVILVFVAIAVLVAVLAHPAMVPWGWIGIGALALVILGVLFAITVLACIAYSSTTAVIYHDQRLRNESTAPAPAV